jgi:hypothetical protein
MPRVVPSDFVKFIDTVWPNRQELINVNRYYAGQLSGLVDLVEQIPSELFVVDSASYALLRSGAHQTEAQHVGKRAKDAARTRGDTRLASAKSNRCNPPGARQMPDESPAPGTSDLEFVTHLDLRASLRNDIGAVSRALSNGEWKAATVLAGSAAEALLLWTLNQLALRPASPQSRPRKRADSNARIPNQRWRNGTCTSTSKWRRRSASLRQTRLAKNFRNFIHPGVAQRPTEKCGRATALSAVAGMEHIVRDLS